MKTYQRILITAVGALGVSAVSAYAGTTGTGGGTTVGGGEFKGAYDTLTAWISGYLGRAIAVAFLIVGLFMGIARQNLIACGVAIAAAFALSVMPAIMDGILGGSTYEAVHASYIEAPALPVEGAK